MTFLFNSPSDSLSSSKSVKSLWAKTLFADRRSVYLLLILLILTVCMGWGVLIGPVDISGETIWHLLLHKLNIEDTVASRPWMETVVFDVRSPRVMVAVLVGATMGICGAAMQGLFKNPLASPEVLGVSSGASLGAVIAIFFGLSTVSIWILPMFAFVGATLTIALVYTIATSRGHTPVGTLLLSGVAVGALNVSMSSFIIALSFENYEVSRMIVFWTMGGLEGRVWDHVWLILPICLLGSTIIITFARDLDVLLLGDIHASSVGVDVMQVRKILLLSTAIMIGGAISVAGGIGFIGLVIPHVMRFIVGPSHRYLLPASFLGGGICLLLADLFLRGLFSQNVIPLGVITSMVGAPFFLYLLVNNRKEFQI